ncbi:MAG: type II secretion system protein GspG [Candidatus Sumerlaeia bacterium]|nr:type II secretion system protein GspG [Candidatus Sumerlaeia bacterium]
MRRRRHRPLRWFLITGLLIWLARQKEPVASAVLAPLRLAQGVGTSVEIQQIHAAIVRERQVSGTLPPPERFNAFIRESFRTARGDPSRDFWGRPYGYRVHGRGFAVWSLGPDGRPGTSDDITMRWEESS